ncbi:FecCD family ABC transporter permease [Lachnoclostridium phytofermentans]|uniref:Transport system permease protein n=1 Tax=Lachnoclostridium phytofermentans (strain ATCC 700394 / DSM 18823 / ISDg) TaxID=357809 RepID=A9KLL0_LACP7|nr:iron ABC transporter permease [Lachnoclostridium phytofermentans]ABX42754.1 transport system permease protein [Lachnoclostridium phytofermentans ISDg]
MKVYKENLSIQIKSNGVLNHSFFLSVPTVFKFVFLGFLLLFSCISAICLGNIDISIQDVIAAIFPFAKPSDSVHEIILSQVRFPRVLSAIFAGTGLSVAGLVLQTLLNNTLAAPEIIGINSGAGLGVVLLFSLLPGQFLLAPFATFLGAFVACLLIAILSYHAYVSKTTILFAGIAISSILNSFSNLLLLLNPNIAVDSQSFMLGSLSGIRMNHRLYLPLLLILISLIVIILFCRYLNALSLGDTIASSLGIRVPLVRICFLILCASLAGSVVSFAGLLGFVGLIVPHIARRFVGDNIKLLIPYTAMLGSFFVVSSDLIGRLLFSPYEVPVGIIMSFLGCPYFIYLLIRQKGAGLYA